MSVSMQSWGEVRVADAAPRPARPSRIPPPPPARPSPTSCPPSRHPEPQLVGRLVLLHDLSFIEKRSQDTGSI